MFKEKSRRMERFPLHATVWPYGSKGHLASALVPCRRWRFLSFRDIFCQPFPWQDKRGKP